jgi:hypothetical protein
MKAALMANASTCEHVADLVEDDPEGTAEEDEDDEG